MGDSGERNRAPCDASKAIVFSRLDGLVDGSCIDDNDPSLFRAIPYQAENYEGRMLGCGLGTGARAIALRLGVEGRHAIWLGVYSFGAGSEFRVRLSSDLCFQRVPLPTGPDRLRCGAVLYEFLWKEADLTGSDLIVDAPRDPNLFPAALAYIRLEPARNPQPETRRTVAHPLTITNDGHGVFGEFLHSRPEDLLESFEDIPRDSCVRILHWGVGGGDMCNYPTKVGDYFTPCGDRYQHHFTDVFFKNMALWKRQGWDSLKLIGDYCRTRGWKFHVYIRVEAFVALFPFDRLNRSSFFDRHPEYHCVDKRGQSVARLSYCHREVQDHMLSLIAEIADYDPDGICLALVRGLPMMLYEPIAVQGFMRQYGVDPRELDEFDHRWLEFQASVLTSFIERVRGTLKQRQELSVITPATEHDCLRWGVDVAGWVKRRLVDTLLPVGQRFNGQDVHVDCPENLDYDFFSGLEGRDRIRLIPMLYPWTRFDNDYEGWRGLLHSYLDRGADGYGVWDGNSLPVSTPFSTIGDIGLQDRAAAVAPRFDFREVRLHSMGGFRMDRYHFFEVV